MRINRWLPWLLLAGCGCSTMNNTEKDGLAGAGAGAVAGAALTRGNPVAAVFGGLLGGLIGTSIGQSEDRREGYQKAVVQAQANAARNQMSLTDIIQLSQRNTPDDVIIRQIDSTGSVFNLRTDDIIDLRNQGVNDRVISVMQARRYPQPVIVGPPPPPGAVIVADPYYGRRW